MLDDDNVLGGGRLIPDSALERFVVGALKHAVKTKTDPPGFVIQLALGTSIPDPVIGQLSNQNESLTARVNALEEAIEHGNHVSSITKNTKDRSRDKKAKKTPANRDNSAKTVTSRNRAAGRAGQDGKSTSKKPRTQQRECDSYLCKHTNGRFSHSRADCHHESILKKHKLTIVRDT
ncbi:unnamed protein product [Ectocarpus sp. CCAP 1310/34]|nr:unnamed protein product [Ectocarpus sp. CCAP 1310/34]CAB1110184.1 unnamed protein product [Ectocarpus sp. CCAP 1310/34]